jgi:phage terminase small subunit
MARQLTDKQERFAEEYVVDFNATQAAIRAGYSAKTARQQGQRMLTNVDIAARVEDLKEAIAERTSVTADKVRKELARHAFTNMRDFVEWGPNGVTLKSSEDLSEDDAAAVTEVSESFGEDGRTLKFKLGHKDSALKLLAQHIGLIGNDGGVNVNQYNFDFSRLSTDKLRDVRDLLRDAAVGPDGGVTRR